MTGIEIFVIGAAVGVASKWGVDQYLSKGMKWKSWRGAKEEPGSFVLEDLQKITGIGPRYAGLLNEAGILNFSDLAAQTPERVREIVESVGLDGTTTWIGQAKALAQESNEAQMAEASQSPELASANA